MAVGDIFDRVSFGINKALYLDMQAELFTNDELNEEIKQVIETCK